MNPNTDHRLKEFLTCNYDFKEVALNWKDWLNILSDHESYGLIDLITQEDVLRTGLAGNLFGINIHVNIKLNVPFNYLKVRIKDKWSVPISFDQLYDIDRLLNLQAFY